MSAEPTTDELADAADMAEVEDETRAAMLGIPVEVIRAERDIDPALLGAEATAPPALAAAIADGDRLGDAFRERTRGMEQITGEEMRTVVGTSVAVPRGLDAVDEAHRAGRDCERDICGVCDPIDVDPPLVPHASWCRDVADRDATIASLRDRLDAALSELGTLRRLHHAGPDPRDATIADLRAQLEERAECASDRDHWRQQHGDVTDRCIEMVDEHIWITATAPPLENLKRLNDLIVVLKTDLDRSNRLHQRALAANRKLRAKPAGPRRTRTRR